MKPTRMWIACAALGVGCGVDPATNGTDEVPSEYIELRLPPVEIPPGTERMYCYFVDNEYGDLAIDHTLGEQGPGGHHLALKATTNRRPSGTLEDCTGGEANVGLHDVHFGGNLPADGAILIPADAQLVLQSHYVNSSDAPQVVADVLRVHRHTVTERTRWMSSMHLDATAVVVPAGHSTRTFECAPAVETSLVVLWGHMHGLGERFSIAAGANVMYQHEWQPSFTAEPPRLLAETTPVVFRPDAPLTVTCEWNNPASSAVGFPDEMCGVGGYVLGQTPFWCEP